MIEDCEGAIIFAATIFILAIWKVVIYYCGHKDIVDKVLPKINEVLSDDRN